MLKLINYEFKCIKNISQFDNCLWHYGKVVEIETPEKSYEIYSMGAVNCELIAKKDIVDEDGNQILKDSVIETVKDDEGMGLFRKNMEKYIKTDEKLRDLLLNRDEDYHLNLSDHNLLYLFIFDKHGIESSMNELNIINVSDAINLVLKLISKDRKNDINSHAIYCRSALINNKEIKSQKQLCLQQLEKKDKNIQNVICYIDNGFSSTNNLSPAMKLMIEDIKQGDLKNISTSSISRLSRNMSNFIDIREILKNNDTDIFLITENKYLLKELFNEVTVPKLSYMIESQTKNEQDLEEELEKE